MIYTIVHMCEYCSGAYTETYDAFHGMMRRQEHRQRATVSNTVADINPALP